MIPMSLISHNILFSLLVFLAVEEIVYPKKNAVEEIVHDIDCRGK